jgi:transposase
MGEKATRRRFTREFKLEAVRQVVKDRRTQKAVAEELGVNANLLGRWIKQFRGDPEQAFPGQGKLKERDKELEDLRRENTRLKGELSFLKKVSAYFAKGQR